MSVHRFFDPDRVDQLNACGIAAQRPTGAPTRGFVLEGRRVPARAREAVTNVIAMHGNVTITGPREQLQLARPERLALPAATTTEPQTALELVEENARLRRDNQRLTTEVERLRGEVARLAAGPNTPRSTREPQDLDDSTTRFSLLELD